MVIPLGLFFFTLSFYLRTLCATFNINDSGETIMDCDLLALAHSPGYPLHTLLGRLFCLLPLGQPMFRLTFGSAVMGAFSVMMVYLILRKILKSSGEPSLTGLDPAAWLLEIPSLFGALVFAFSYQHWFQSDGAKGSIYTFNSLLAVMTLFLLLKMREAGWFIRGFLLAGFFLGMGLSVHWETQVVLLPAYGWFLLAAQRRVAAEDLFRNWLRPFDLWNQFRVLLGAFGGKPRLVRALTFLLLPLSTYLYLPIRAHGNPVLNWWNPGSFSRFVTVVMRKNYDTPDNPYSLATFHRNLARFWLHAHDQYGGLFTPVVFLLALAGLAWLWKRRRADTLGLFLFGGSVLAGVILHNATRAGYEWTLDNFFTPVFLTLAFFAGAGVASLCGWFSKQGLSPLARLSLGAACLGLSLMPLGSNYGANDQSAYTVSYDEGLNMLKTVSRDGVILCNGDIDILPLWYLQLVEGKRPEVASLTTQLVGLQWYRDDIFRDWPFLQTSLQGDGPPDRAVEGMIHDHGSQRPFYVTNIFPQGAAWLWKFHPLVPDGMLWRLADTQGQNFAFNSARLNQLWSRYDLRNLGPPKGKYWDDYTDVMKDSYGQACSFTGEAAMNSQNPQLAKWSYEKALEYHQPQVKGVTYLGLADAEMALGSPVDAVSHYQQAFRFYLPSAYVPYTYARLGDAFLLEKDYLNAQDAFHLSLRFDPRQKEALEGLRRLEGIRSKMDHPA
jgi:tetratricopeptide (TPR) repeat protein